MELYDLIDTVSPYFFTIIYMFVILFVVAKIKRKAKGSSDIVKPAAKALYTSSVSGSINNRAAMKNNALKSYNTQNEPRRNVKNGLSLTDDRKSDWLARQLREEAAAMVVISDMFQLKNQHVNNCDAEFIKRFHESNCDAYGIDDGIKK